MISALIIIVFFVPYTASGFKAVGTLFNTLLGLDYHIAMIIGAIIIVAYTTLGGFLAVSTTDLVQSIFMTIALIVIVFFGINVAGGWDVVVKNAQALPGYLNINQGYIWDTGEAGTYGFLSVVSTLAWGLGYFGMPHILLRFMGIRDENELKTSRRIASVWCAVSMSVAILIGIIGYSVSLTGSIPILGTNSEAETIIIQMATLMSKSGVFFALVAGVILAGILIALDALLLAFLMAAGRSWHFDMKWIIILVIVDFLLLFQLMPLVYMVIKAFFPDSTFSYETFKRLYTYSLNLDALRNTSIAALSTMVVGTLLAFPLAWLIGRTNLYGRKFFRSLFVLTYMVPPYVGAMAWRRLLNPNVGTINQWIRALLHLSDAPGPMNVYSLPGLIWVLSTFYYPYAFITISRAMEKMDPSLEEASRISGASPLKTVFTVTLPLMMPSLISGALLVFVSAASCYGIPSIIGSPGRVHTVTTRIVEYVSLGQQGLNDATGMAVFLMVVAILILFLSDVVLAKKQYITVSGKSVSPAIVDLRRWRIPLTILVSLFAVIVILIPFATIFSTSFKIDVGKSMLTSGNFTLTNWKTVFGRIETMNCLKNSLIYGAVAATVGIVIACTMSYLLQRTKIRGRKIPDFLITLGSGTPSVVIALGLIMTMKGNFGINIYNTAYIMIIAYLIKYLMMGMRTVVSAMSQIHVSLEECSQIAGASWLRTMFRITGRLIFPSIAAGWFLIFIPSFYELSMTTLLYSSTTKTIGFQLYEYWTFTSQPMACAMAFGILVIVVILNFVLNRLTKGEFSI